MDTGMGVLSWLKSVATALLPGANDDDVNEADEAEDSSLPAVYLLATGGTIAGVGSGAEPVVYRAGAVGVETLVEAIPGINQLARVSVEQFANIGSQDMDDARWLKLSRRVNEVLARDDVDALVVTHGTDTLEETAYFLDLTVASAKPVILVGAMRPSNELSADGPANLLDAVAVAVNPETRTRGGIMAVMHGDVFEARDLVKISTVSPQAFAAPNYGPLGHVYNGQVIFRPQSGHELELFDVATLEALPAVGIVYAHANASAVPVKALVEAEYQGIVLAGVGNGNVHHQLLEALAEAARAGVVVVRASRVLSGPVVRNVEVDDERYGFIAAGTLNPQKARVLLQLALTRTREPGEIQALFERL
ncbi:L-asparaginase 2 [Betaproteobacteria bacterium]|nr:L-asparaginase 2 [Betaproteobacteria bacterium]